MREGSMAKWGCHVVDSKPRSAVSLRFFFICLPNTLFYSVRYCGLIAWQPGKPGTPWSPRPSASWLGAGDLAVGRSLASHVAAQPVQSAKLPRRPASSPPSPPNEMRTTTQGRGKSNQISVRDSYLWVVALGPAPLEHCHIDGALIVVGRSSPGTPDHCPCLPSDELTGPRRQGHEPV